MSLKFPITLFEGYITMTHLQKWELAPPQFEYFIEEHFGFHGFFVFDSAIFRDGSPDRV